MEDTTFGQLLTDGEDDYQIYDKIGEGGYAEVFRVKRKRDMKVFALKRSFKTYNED